MCFLFEVRFCPLMIAFTFHNIVLLALAFLQPTRGKKKRKKKVKKINSSMTNACADV